MKILLSSTVILFLASCKPITLYFQQPEGPPEYVQGWNDGCETGLSLSNNTWQRMTYSFKRDPTMLDDPYYRAAWTEAQAYCRMYSTNATESTDKFFQGLGMMK